MVLDIELEFNGKISYVMYQNNMDVALLLNATNNGDELGRVTFRIDSEPPFFREFECGYDAMMPGDRFDVISNPSFNVDLDAEYISSITERVLSKVTVVATEGGEVVGRAECEVQILPYDYWPGTGMPELIASFITPNSSGLTKIRSDASDILKSWGESSSLEGYQGDRDRVLRMGAAVYAALEKHNINYINPPAGFETSGQRVRLPDDVLTNHEGTCIDLAALYAAALESIGLNTVVFFVKGHAFAGFWLVDDCSPDMISYDSAAFTRRIRNEEMRAVECTMFTSGSHADFNTACDRALARLEDQDGFVCALDILRARHVVTPLPVKKMVDGGWVIDRDNEVVKTTTPENLERIYEDPESKSLTKDEKWKRELLDITGHNNLIKMKPGSKVVPVMLENISEFEDEFSEGREFGIYSKPQEWDGTSRYNEKPFETEVYISNYRDAAKADLARNRLRVPLTDLEAEKTLRSIYRQANKELEESGCNALFLALGILRWYEKDSSRTANYAPLILIPVEIRKKQNGYGIRKLDEETVFNVTLLEKLRQEYEIDLPNMDPLPVDESGVNVDQIIQTVRRKISGMNRWEVLRGTALGVFSFSQYAMWKDLDSNIDVIGENPIVKCLLESTPYPAAKELNEESDPYDLCLTVPADGSQIKAVNAANNGKTFVMHGPPGTGKSQTITNMITNALYHGKRVLFVAEKQAALQVVQKRLEEVGIGKHCMELHSNKTQKSKVLDQLRSALELDKPFDEKVQKEIYDRLMDLRRKLDAYVVSLHKEQRWGLSAYDCISRYEECNREGTVSVSIPTDLVSKLNPAVIRDVEDRLRYAWKAYDAVKGLRCGILDKIHVGNLRASIESEMREMLETVEAAASDYEECRSAAMALDLPLPISDRDGINRLFDSISKADVETARIPSVTEIPDVSARFMDELRRFIDTLKEWQDLGMNASAQNTEAYIRSLDSMKASLDGFLRRDYVDASSETPAAMENLRKLANSYIGIKKDMDIVLTVWKGDVFALDSEYKVGPEWSAAANAGFFKKGKMRKEFLSRVSPCLRNPSTEFDALSGTVNLIGGISADVVRISREMPGCIRACISAASADMDAAGRLRDRTVSALESVDRTGLPLGKFLDIYDTVPSSRIVIDRYTASEERWNNACRDLDALMNLDDPPKTVGEFRAFADELGPQIGHMFDWVNWNHYADKLLELGLRHPVELIMNGIDEECLVDSTDKSIYELMIKLCRQESETLRMFSADNFESMIREFKELDHRYTENNKKLLKCRLSMNLPHNLDGSVPDSEANILYKAVNSKTLRKSIRKLLSQIPNVLPMVCPCLLMSPQSVSQYITRDYPPFDLVIFDESSQITTCKAVCALGHSKNAVIAGDSNQLPPTSFFHKKLESFGDDDDDLSDIDSFLDDCLALNMPETYLEWHYRSRHESLITFSNRMFYDNKMLTFPSPNDQEARVSMRMTGGVYEKKVSNNVVEANAVVDEVYRRVMDPELRKHSIGIVAFSSNQQKCIQDILDDRIKNDSDFFENFNGMPEEMFVKNLETVQGDERDVILFSIGYGPTSEGVVSQNFGPINRQGGGRRLNVAVSRARDEMIVFTSMKYTDVKLTPSSSSGVRSLREFLRFAENGGRFSENSMHTARTGESTVLNEIASSLEENGYECHFNIGSSEFKVDIAVINPECPNEYILGILTDGESYRSSVNTRDREFARADVLRRLGWNITHVWSVEWYFNRKNTVEDLLSTLEDLKNNVNSCSIEPEVQEEEEEPEEEPETAMFGERISSYETPMSVKNPNVEDYHPFSMYPTTLYEDIRPFGHQTKDLLEKIVYAESPISEECLVRTFARSVSIKRISAKTRDLITTAARRVIFNTTEGSFVTYWNGQKASENYGTKYRLNPNHDPRDLELVSLPELKNAIVDIVRESGSISEEGIPAAVARVFGYGRTGSKAKAIVEEALSLAVKDGLVVNTFGRITIKS